MFQTNLSPYLDTEQSDKDMCPSLCPDACLRCTEGQSLHSTCFLKLPARVSGECLFWQFLTQTKQYLTTEGGKKTDWNDNGTLTLGWNAPCSEPKGPVGGRTGWMPGTCGGYCGKYCKTKKRQCLRTKHSHVRQHCVLVAMPF